MKHNQILLHSLIFSVVLLSAVAASTQADRQSAERFVDGPDRSLEYLLYLPNDYDGESIAWPLLLFLHGGGESGHNLDLVKRHGPPRLIEDGKTFPMIIVSPQNPDLKGFWDEDLLADLLEELTTRYRVDSSRIYLTGLSRGGYGAWRLAMENPGRFAALVPISGAAPAPYANWLKDMPVWVFHGARDPVIPVAESERIVEAIRKRGGSVKFTVYPEAGHDAWTETYANPEIWEWMLNQHR